MTNEQIYKYADKKLQKQENRVLLATWLPFIMGLFGQGMIFFVFDSIEYSYIVSVITLALLSLGGIMLWLMVNTWEKWFKLRRNYIYNLVRLDESKRMYEWLNGLCNIHKSEKLVCRVDCVQCNKELRKSLGIE
jgi:hypothetical protein